MQRPFQGLSLKYKSLINDWENIIAYWEESKRSEEFANNVSNGETWRQYNSKKTRNFFYLKNVLFSRYLDFYVFIYLFIYLLRNPHISKSAASS